MSNANSPGRIHVAATAEGVEITIDPLIRQRGWRLAASALAVAGFGGVLLSAGRLVKFWDGATRGATDLPVWLLLLSTAAVLLAVPLTLIGLAYLLFAEESLTLTTEQFVQEIVTPGKTERRQWPAAKIECWRKTVLPLPPWWTWTVVRLAARVEGRLHAVGVACGVGEKGYLAELLSRYSGVPVCSDLEAWRRRRGGRGTGQ